MFRYTVFDSLKNFARMFWASGLGMSCIVNLEGQLLARLESIGSGTKLLSENKYEKYISLHFWFPVLDVRRYVAWDLSDDIGLIGLFLFDPL